MELNFFFLIFTILGGIISTPTILGTFQPSLPSNTYLIGTLSVGNIINLNLAWLEQTTGTFTIVICWNRDSNNIDTTTYTTSPASLNYTATVAGEYSVRIFYT